jgi:hypothetical protein
MAMIGAHVYNNVFKCAQLKAVVGGRFLETAIRCMYAGVATRWPVSTWATISSRATSDREAAGSSIIGGGLLRYRSAMKHQMS